jgi:hypothetical protein
MFQHPIKSNLAPIGNLPIFSSVQKAGLIVRILAMALTAVGAASALTALGTAARHCQAMLEIELLLTGLQ